MSLVLDVLVVAGGVVVGRWIARRIRGRGGAEATGNPAAPERRVAADRLAGFPFKLGDVVMRVAERDEAWLAGALVFEEDAPTAALFIAPEAGGDRAVYVRKGPGPGLTWLAPLAPGELTLAGDPPHAIEHAGARFERSRRLPVRVSRVGTGAPAVGERAVVAEYDGPAAERLIVVAGTDQRLAWRGVALSDGEYDVLPGGKNTLDA